MSHTDRRRGTIPARTSDLVPLTSAMPARGLDDARLHHDDAGPPRPGRRVSAGLIWRATRRHCWLAILAWLAGSGGLVALAHLRVRPTYDACSTIRIEPGDRALFREDNAGVDFEAFKETQARRITNPNVIAAALSAHPELLKSPRLAGSPDPEAEIRKAIGVTMIPRTHLIQVAMSSGEANEPAEIVNAVVEAYLGVALDSDEAETEKRARRLREVKAERTLAVGQGRRAIEALVSRIGMVDVRKARDRNPASVDAYSILTGQHLQADLDLVEARARLDQIRATAAASPVDPGAVEAGIIAAFYDTPQVAEIRARLDQARQELAQADRLARDPGDPARQGPKKRVDDLQRQIDTLWARMRPALARGDGRPEAELRAAELRVSGLNTRLAQLGERLERLNVQTRAAGTDELTLEFARQDLNRAEVVLDTVTRSLDQAEFDGKGPVARFRQDYKARASSVPNVDHRLKVMAAAPLGMLVGVVGLMVLVELRGGRVADPDDLPARVRLDVLGVVPPLPRRPGSPGIARGRDQARSRRELDQFTQSIDHLRVALCSARDRRSILITSACSGEGKTTLAARLAERCVNAGLLTLLIDADIRNPTLSRMFDLSTSPGLVNVLRGESAAEEAISTIEGAGGFHFLPAGSPRDDPSRSLQGEGLARLLASARASFDIVLVDSPPVLPVPDALTIGRWVDGAVLAVRFDSSRYPLVDRARRRLAALEIPVIGAVVNGVRGYESAYYGGDYRAYGSPDGDDGARVEA